MGWGRSVTREIGRINQRRKLKGERFLKYIAKEKTAGRFSERELCYGRVEISFYSSGGEVARLTTMGLLGVVYTSVDSQTVSIWLSSKFYRVVALWKLVVC